MMTKIQITVSDDSHVIKHCEYAREVLRNL
jgi:hypothetical protein